MDLLSASRLIETEKIRMTQPAVLNDIFENPIQHEGEDIVDRALDRIEQNLQKAVTCYTETPTNLLMWSHYADEYRGIVVAFNAEHEFFNNLQRVRYRDQRGDFMRAPERRILIKGNDWIYEKEWRQVWNPLEESDETIGDKLDIQRAIYLRKLPVDAVEQIVYGPRYMENDQDKAVEFLGKLQREHKNIEILGARASLAEFKLELYPMPKA